MCNIAGYIGTEKAAPILIEMIKRQEGFCGGYYTGISTLHEGEIHSAKVVGDVGRLLSETDAMNFPGNIGIIHSRSKSGGDWHWGHPFLSNDGKLSVVLNGDRGKYKSICDVDGAVKLLSENGFSFETETDEFGRGGDFGRLPNGNFVHASEVICQLTDYYMKKENLKTHLALERAFLRNPSEIVVLALCGKEYGTINYAKFNMPMTLARTETEVFLSSMSIALPDNRNYISVAELPAGSSGSITVDKTEMHWFRSPLEIGRLTPSVMCKAYEAVIGAFAEHKICSVGMLNDAVRGLWEDKVDLRYPVVYSILDELKSEDELEIVESVVSGVNPSVSAVKFEMMLKRIKRGAE